MHAVEAFLLALTNKSVHGRVLLTKEEAGLRLKFLLLHPSEAFQPIVEAARAVLLAGGTMEPVRAITHLDCRLSDTAVGGLACRQVCVLFVRTYCAARPYCGGHCRCWP